MTSLPANGTRLCFDVGVARVGVAKCGADQIMAIPVETLNVTDNLVETVSTLIKNDPIGAIYVGLPLNLKGESTPSTELAIEFAQNLSKCLIEEGVDIPLRLVDERFSTTIASRNLKSVGRSVRSGRLIIDQAAAVEILNYALAVEKRESSLAGTEI